MKSQKSKIESRESNKSAMLLVFVSVWFKSTRISIRCCRIVGKSCFTSEILFYGEYFSEFFRAFFQIFRNIYIVQYFLVLFRILSIFPDYQSIFPNFEYFPSFARKKHPGSWILGSRFFPAMGVHIRCLDLKFSRRNNSLIFCSLFNS